MRRRKGFTLVELMVAVALIVFIMAILSEAFVAASKTFRDLKAAGDLADQLRSTTAVLRRYLAADHFEGKRRLSDPNFWAAGPPLEGFFRVYQGSPAGAYPRPQPGNPPYPPFNFVEDNGDPNGIVSVCSVDHMLHFAVKLRGNSRSEFFSAVAPGTPLLTLGLPESRYQDTPNTANVYNSQWAEVVFFLRAIPDPSTGTQARTSPTLSNPSGVPLYGLYVRQLLAVPDNAGAQVQFAGNITNFPEISGTYAGVNVLCNSPRDLTQPIRRFGMTGQAGTLVFKDPLTQQVNAASNFLTYNTMQDPGATQAASSALWGSDLLLTNVISFDVRLRVPSVNGDFVDMCTLGTSFNNGNPSFNPGTGPMVFDTWSSIKDDQNDYSGWQANGNAASIPMWSNGTGPSVQAIQITLRIWNEKAEATRQVTIEVPL